VDVLVSDMPRMNVTVFPLCNVFELSFQFLFNVSVLEYRTSVLRTPHDVVVTDPRDVRLGVQSSVHG
jgi:hypothetical protein